MLLQDIANTLGIKEHFGSESCRNFQIDSRLVQPGDVFVALSDKRDGHDYIHDAYNKGAIAAIVSHDISNPPPIPLIPVKNTLESLTDLAKYCRKKFKGHVIAITGSTGKTTVKEMIANILELSNKTLYSHKTFNNHIGVPLTLCRLNNNYKFAVIELGANHLGEIKKLSSLVSPHTAIINNISEAHIGEFGDFQNIITAKSEIFSGTHANGTAIINDHEEKITNQLKKAAVHLNTIVFNLHKGDFHAKNIKVSENSSTFTAITPYTPIDIKLNIPGQHNIENALSAVCATYKLTSVQNIIKGLRSIESISGRLNSIQLFDNTWMIDDTYNASPNSVKAAIKYLEMLKGCKILVLGEMAELGSRTQYHHQQIGILAQSSGINQVYTIGENAKIVSDYFGNNGKHFSHQDDLINYLIKNVGNNTYMLIKGSRSTRMENVVNSLSKHFSIS
jgi:UDP-N-acetylmuramoyl-tripeptide--D-alanyl-D-alanine ligase